MKSITLPPLSVVVSGGTGSIVFNTTNRTYIPTGKVICVAFQCPLGPAPTYGYYALDVNGYPINIGRAKVTGNQALTEEGILTVDGTFYIVNATVDGTYLVSISMDLST
jgi:hypothetical protein